MKEILDTYKLLKIPELNEAQYNKGGNRKNVLFVSPQLTSNCLYSVLIPSIVMDEQQLWNPAITMLHKLRTWEIDI